MRIYIDSIDDELVEQGDDSGYRVTFRSDLTCGAALLAATAGSAPLPVAGRELFVEVEAQAYQNMRPLSAGEATEYRFIALPQAGCYELVGEIVYAVPQEAADYPMLAVRVADALLHWAPDPNNRATLSAGTWLRFNIAGLVLWDKNL